MRTKEHASALDVIAVQGEGQGAHLNVRGKMRYPKILPLATCEGNQWGCSGCDKGAHHGAQDVANETGPEV
jgi:hypothetical protein